jgi:hypothetical protein
VKRIINKCKRNLLKEGNEGCAKLDKKVETARL